MGLAAFHLNGEAQLWFYKAKQEGAGMNWETFTEQCHLRFGPPMSLNPLGELANLKQIETVEEYQREFQSLLAQTTELTTKQQISLFTAGLLEGLRLEVELQEPTSLGAAMNLARTYEKKQNSNQAILGGYRRAAPPWSSLITTTEGTVIGKGKSSTASTNLTFFKKLW